MFNPSRDQVRQFFIETWRKHRALEVLTPLEAMALGWIEKHPEYHADIEQSDAMTREFNVEEGRTNPFLHLSMHLAIAEQLSIDHRAGFEVPMIPSRHAQTLIMPRMKSWNALAKWSGNPSDWGRPWTAMRILN